MSVRKVLATLALAGGLSGAGLIVANPSLVIGSTSDAGVMTICVNKKACSPGGPTQNPTAPAVPVTNTSGSTASAP